MKYERNITCRVSSRVRHVRWSEAALRTLEAAVLGEGRTDEDGAWRHRCDPLRERPAITATSAVIVFTISPVPLAEFRPRVGLLGPYAYTEAP
jgi:hypothetical protein